MAFDRQLPVTAVAIGDIQVILDDPNPAAPNSPIPSRPQSATAIIQVMMSDGSSRTVHANLPNYFSAAAINQLRTFVASVRTKTNAEILGG